MLRLWVCFSLVCYWDNDIFYLYHVIIVVFMATSLSIMIHYYVTQVSELFNCIKWITVYFIHKLKRPLVSSDGEISMLLVSVIFTSTPIPAYFWFWSMYRPTSTSSCLVLATITTSSALADSSNYVRKTKWCFTIFSYARSSSNSFTKCYVGLSSDVKSITVIMYDAEMILTIHLAFFYNNRV